MPSTDVESHFKFLLSCIKHSAAGKVNFDAVASELGIVSKAAAAKRYERLLKAHDITPAPATPKKNAEGTGGGGNSPKTPGGRKRKATKMSSDQGDDEDIKTEAKTEAKTESKPLVKDEEDNDMPDTPKKQQRKTPAKRTPATKKIKKEPKSEAKIELEIQAKTEQVDDNMDIDVKALPAESGSELSPAPSSSHNNDREEAAAGGV